MTDHIKTINGIMYFDFVKYQQYKKAYRRYIIAKFSAYAVLFSLFAANVYFNC